MSVELMGVVNVYNENSKYEYLFPHVGIMQI